MQKYTYNNVYGVSVLKTKSSETLNTFDTDTILSHVKVSEHVFVIIIVKSILCYCVISLCIYSVHKSES